MRSVGVPYFPKTGTFRTQGTGWPGGQFPANLPDQAAAQETGLIVLKNNGAIPLRFRVGGSATSGQDETLYYNESVIVWLRGYSWIWISDLDAGSGATNYTAGVVEIPGCLTPLRHGV